MRPAHALLGFAALAAAFAVAPSGAQAACSPAPCAPSVPLTTLRDVGEALKVCWQWPPLDAVQTGMELTIMVSFRRNGEIFGARITHQSRTVSAEERALYHRAMADMLQRCSPLPVSVSLGGAIAGRPFTFRINDTRKQRDAGGTRPGDRA